MEDPRCKIAAIEAEDPRCKNLLSGVEIEMEDPRCKSLLIRVVIGMEDPRCRIEAVKTEDPRCKNLHMLAGDELVRPTEKDFSGEVPARFATEGTRDGDGLERKFLPTGEHVAAAPLAGDDEGFAA